MLIRKVNAKGGTVNLGLGDGGEGVRDALSSEDWQQPEELGCGSNSTRAFNARATDDQVNTRPDRQFGSWPWFRDKTLDGGSCPNACFPGSLGTLDNLLSRSTKAGAQFQKVTRQRRNRSSNLVITLGRVI